MTALRPLDRLPELSVYEASYAKKTLRGLEIIKEMLEEYGVSYHTFEHYVRVPEWKWSLEVGGEEAFALPSGLRSGRVEKNLVDSSELEVLNIPNINYNSRLASTIDVSTPVFHEAPALSVSKRTADKIRMTDDVSGYLVVEDVVVKNVNLVLGDIGTTTDTVVVAHYDSLWTGAVDNASGTLMAIAAHLLTGVPTLLLGFTEITLEKGRWKYVLDKASAFLKKAIEVSGEFVSKPPTRVVVIDCVGYEGSDVIKDKEYVEAYSVFGDITVVGTPMYNLMEIYHSTIDTPDKVNPQKFARNLEQVIGIIKGG